MIRVENLMSQQYLLNRDVLFSYLDRRSTTYFDRRRPPVYCVLVRVTVYVGCLSGVINDDDDDDNDNTMTDKICCISKKFDKSAK